MNEHQPQPPSGPERQTSPSAVLVPSLGRRALTMPMGEQSPVDLMSLATTMAEKMKAPEVLGAEASFQEMAQEEIDQLTREALTQSLAALAAESPNDTFPTVEDILAGDKPSARHQFYKICVAARKAMADANREARGSSNDTAKNAATKATMYYLALHSLQVSQRTPRSNP